jgi:ectoine hydroxylase-related dioxygenase (phytanoyl-CoA dioxygenase family)
MTLDGILRNLSIGGWCVLEGIIPPAETAAVRDAVWGEIQAQKAAWEEEVARIGRAGFQPPPSKVAQAEALINHLPQVASYIAHPRLLQVCEALLGPRLRVSSVGGISTYPGNERGYWHADWPYNGTLATCLPVPYPDFVMNLSAIFMLTNFSVVTGGTLIVPGTHRQPDNPSTGNGFDRLAPHPAEMNVEGEAGSVLLYDSRLWHAVPPNRSDRPRTIMTVRYTPWWINLEVRRPGAADQLRVLAAGSGKDNSVPLMPRAVFASLPEEARPLFIHWLEPEEAACRA